MPHHDNGNAKLAEISTNNKKSFDNNVAMLDTLAPSTLRTAISLKRCLIVNAARPNNPRHATNNDRMVKSVSTDRMFFSSLYNSAKSSSRKVYLKGLSVVIAAHVFSISLKV